MNGLTSSIYADISIIVPAYQASKYIERCLRSLISLRADNFSYNIVVIDDGSTDGTADIVRNFFPDVILSVNPENMGLPSSLNIGIRAVSSQYFVRVDSDDFVDSMFLEFLYYAIAHNDEFEAICCDYYTVSDEGQRVARMSAELDPIGCGILFRRDKLVAIGLYDADFHAREEEELMIRFQKAEYQLLRLPLPLYRYRQHDNSITSNLEMMDKFSEELKRRHLDDKNEN